MMTAHERLDGDHVFSASRNVPWDDLGADVSGATDSATAIKLAGLDWEVKQAPVRYFDGKKERTVDSLRVNYRVDTGEPLGIVTNRYAVVQNRTVFEFADRLIGKGLEFDVAGTIQDGRRVWIQAHLPERKILDDKISSHLLFSNGHDGNTGIQVYMTPTRVCCTNMLNFAIKNAIRRWSIPHFKSVRKKMLDARKTLEHVGHYMEELSWRAETLAVEKLGRDDFQLFIEKMFPAEDTERKNNRIKREIERFRDCYGVDDLENFKGTKWGLLLAVSDYVTHKPVKTIRQAERHFAQMLEGHELLDKAYSLIATM